MTMGRTGKATRSHKHLVHLSGWDNCYRETCKHRLSVSFFVVTNPSSYVLLYCPLTTLYRFHLDSPSKRNHLSSYVLHSTLVDCCLHFHMPYLCHDLAGSILEKLFAFLVKGIHVTMPLLVALNLEEMSMKVR